MARACAEFGGGGSRRHAFSVMVVVGAAEASVSITGRFLPRVAFSPQ
jgi:hypothetical protein